MLVELFAAKWLAAAIMRELDVVAICYLVGIPVELRWVPARVPAVRPQWLGRERNNAGSGRDLQNVGSMNPRVAL